MNNKLSKRENKFLLELKVDEPNPFKYHHSKINSFIYSILPYTLCMTARNNIFFVMKIVNFYAYTLF